MDTHGKAATHVPTGVILMVGSQILDQKRLLELFLVHGFISIVNSFNFLKSLHGLRKRLTVTMYHCWLIALMLLHISCDHPAKRVSCSSESSYCKGPEGSPKGIFERLLGVELQLQPADLVCVIDESLQDSHLLFLLVLLFLGLFFFRRTHCTRCGTSTTDSWSTISVSSQDVADLL